LNSGWRQQVLILERIVASKRIELAERKAKAGLGELVRRAGEAAPCRDFAAAVSGEPGHAVRLIGEFKRASPSKGLIRDDLEPGVVGRIYEAAGASAMSILTDGPFFSGSLDDLREAREAVGLPLLRKDFTLESYQLYEARCAGADAVLLIAAILEEARLRDLREEAAALGMAALVEVHDEAELERAVASGAGIIGVNNRDLKTFSVDIETTFRLKREMPDDVVTVSESGIRARDDMMRLREAGIDAALVGETCMRRKDPGEAVRELLGRA